MIMISETVLDSGTVKLLVEGHLEDRDLEIIKEQLDRYLVMEKRVAVDIRNLRNIDVRWHRWAKEIEGEIEWIGLSPHTFMGWS